MVDHSHFRSLPFCVSVRPMLVTGAEAEGGGWQALGLINSAPRCPPMPAGASRCLALPRAPLPTSSQLINSMELIGIRNPAGTNWNQLELIERRKKRRAQLLASRDSHSRATEPVRSAVRCSGHTRCSASHDDRLKRAPASGIGVYTRCLIHGAAVVGRWLAVFFQRAREAEGGGGAPRASLCLKGLTANAENPGASGTSRPSALL